MRYERASPAGGGRATSGVRRAIAAAVALLVAATVAGVVVGSRGGGTGVPPQSGRARALEREVVRVMTLEENLGAPAPPGLTSRRWALEGDAMRGTPSSPALVRPGRAWVRPDGSVALLGAGEAAAILRSQSSEVRAVTAGALRAELLGELAGLVAGERRPGGPLSSPGGARAVTWLSVTLDGGRATADGYVDTWDARTTVRALPGGGHAATTAVVFAEVEAVAGLVRSAAGWRVDSLAEKPYQQAT